MYTETHTNRLPVILTVRGDASTHTHNWCQTAVAHVAVLHVCGRLSS